MKSARAFTTVISLVTIIGSIVSPAGAERSAIPAKPNITDPAGDANYLYFTDHVGGPNRPEADLLAAWFSSRGKALSVNWHVAASPLEKGLVFNVYATPNPTQPTYPEEFRVIRNGHCYWFTAIFPNQADPWNPYGGYGNNCVDSDLGFASRPKIVDLVDGSAIVSLVFKTGRRSTIGPGDVLTRPWAAVGHFTVVGNQYIGLPRVDSTPAGRDFTVP